MLVTHSNTLLNTLSTTGWNLFEITFFFAGLTSYSTSLSHNFVVLKKLEPIVECVKMSVLEYVANIHLILMKNLDINDNNQHLGYWVGSDQLYVSKQAIEIKKKKSASTN